MTTSVTHLMTGLDPDGDAYWAEVEDGHIPVRRCETCDTRFVLPLPSCPECGSVDLTTVRSAGRGSMYTWVVVHHAFDDDLAAQTPYVIGAVELDERARIFARVEGVELDALAPELRLRAVFPGEDGRPPIVFVPEEAS